MLTTSTNTTTDSGKMTSFGAVAILHEMLHWNYLVRTEENENQFDDLITHLVQDQDDEDEEELDERDFIDDYSDEYYEDRPITPIDGYGPVNTAKLVVNNEGDSVQNADNYRWYMVSKTWEFICAEQYAVQTDQSRSDTMVPIGSKGQVPYPGERP